MKTLKWVFVAAIVGTASAFLIDFCLHPGAYLDNRTGAIRTEVTPPQLTSGNPQVQVPIRTAIPTATPPPLLQPEPSPTLLSPLDLESVHQLIRDRMEKDLEGQSFVWDFIDFSSVVWSPCVDSTEVSPRFLALKGRKNLWFAVALPPGLSPWGSEDLRRNLGTHSGRVIGKWIGVRQGIPTGPEWYRMKRVPVLLPSTLEWIDQADSDLSNSHDYELLLSEEDLSSSQDPKDRSSASIAPSPNPATQTSESSHRVVDVRTEKSDLDPIFERYSPWSLIHLLYQEGQWLLSDTEYESVENWDRRMRNQFETFDSPLVQQVVVSDFIRLLGYEKASRVGIVFNGDDGFPKYRWFPDQESQEIEKPPQETDKGARNGFLKGLTGIGDPPGKEPHPQTRILEDLFSGRKEIAQAVISRTRNSAILIQPFEEGSMFRVKEGEEILPLIRDLLDLTHAEEMVFRVQPAWLDQIESRYGEPESLKSEPYPYSLPTDSGTTHILPGSLQWPSIVWHTYGGVRIGKTNALVETLLPSPDSVAVMIDIPRWRRLNRPGGLTQN